MTKKILFWLDAHLVYFGIAKFLQEKLNFDSYAIVDINNSAKPFFQTGAGCDRCKARQAAKKSQARQGRILGRMGVFF